MAEENKTEQQTSAAGDARDKLESSKQHESHRQKPLQTISFP